MGLVDTEMTLLTPDDETYHGPANPIRRITYAYTPDGLLNEATA